MTTIVNSWDTRPPLTPGARWRRSTLGRFLRNPLGLLAFVIVLILALMALFPTVWTPADPFQINPVQRLKPPSSEHWFGTDELGRDLFSRVIHGTRVSLGMSLSIVVLTAILGTLLGMLAAYIGGLTDDILMRVSDIFISFPALIMAMAIVTLLGPSLENAMLTLVIIWWPQYAWLARGQTLRIKHFAYIEAARAVGVPAWRVLIRHIFPNIAQSIIIKGSLDVGLAILTTASLSFLGLGPKPPSPELGVLITQGRNFLLSAWWYATFPGLFIFLAVLGFNILGDVLRDVLDPTLRVDEASA